MGATEALPIGVCFGRPSRESAPPLLSGFKADVRMPAEVLGVNPDKWPAGMPLTAAIRRQSEDETIWRVGPIRQGSNEPKGIRTGS